MLRYITIFFIIMNIEAEVLSRTQVLMGTYITISVDEKDKSYIEDGFNIVKKIDLSLSSYNENSLVYKLNIDKKINLSTYLYEALSLSEKYYKKTDGYFDITIGSITKDLYKFGEDERVPTSTELSEADVSFNALVFDKKEVFLDKNVKIDLGGMGKGFAVDKVAEYYRVNNVENALIAASGDIRCLDICSVDVNNPFSKKPLVRFKTLKKDFGISTSGNYNRYVTSVKYNHLINPKSKISQDKFISITLISELANSDLDAYTTAASVMPIEKAYKFLDSLDVAYIVLQNNKELRFSNNLSKYTRDLIIYDTAKK